MLETVRWVTADGRVLSEWEDHACLLPGKVRLIDQTLLPAALATVDIDSLPDMEDAIRRLVVRGAPAIGCAAALGLAATAQHYSVATSQEFLRALEADAERLGQARPTAVNLTWALQRCCRAVTAASDVGVDALKLRLLREALSILEEDIGLCRAIGDSGAPLITDGAGILTHCNAGALATGDYGTALAVMYSAHEAGRTFTVYSDETRPLLQGSRLTAWELQRAGINVVTLCDNMAGWLMRSGQISLVIVGADRVAANGDTANKIGTYSVAVLAHHHHIPFYVAVPYSTLDLARRTAAPSPLKNVTPTRFASSRVSPPLRRISRL